MSESEHYPRLSPFRAGLACKCPRCGRGPLYSGFLTVTERCPVCGLDLKKADSGDGPAVFIIFILGFLVVSLALLFEAKIEPPMWLHVAIWPALTLGTSGGVGDGEYPRGHLGCDETQGGLRDHGLPDTGSLFWRLRFRAGGRQ